MPSVRVKRSQYAHIDDIFPEGSQGRPRSQSVNHPNEQTSSSVAQPPNVRHRSHTVSGLGGNPSQRRPTSKISDHIMATCRTPRLESAQFSYDRQSSRTGRPRAATDSGLRPNLDRSEVISLQGSNENIIYHGDAQRLGRINSAFSTHEEDDEDGEHHHDDIVEHLEVIGMFATSPRTMHADASCDISKQTLLLLLSPL